MGIYLSRIFRPTFFIHTRISLLFEQFPRSTPYATYDNNLCISSPITIYFQYAKNQGWSLHYIGTKVGTVALFYCNFFHWFIQFIFKLWKERKKKQKKKKLNSYIMNPLNVTPNEHFELYLFCYRTESLKEKNICDGKIHKNNFITIPFPWANTNYVSIATFRNKINQNLIIYKKKEIYILC